MVGKQRVNGFFAALIVLAFSIVCAPTNGKSIEEIDGLANKLKLVGGQISVNCRDGPESIDKVRKNIEDAEKTVASLKEALAAWKVGHEQKATTAEKSKEPLHERIFETVSETTGPVAECSKSVEEGDTVRVHYIGKDLQSGSQYTSTFHTGSIPERLIAGDEADAPLATALIGGCEGERRRLKSSLACLLRSHLDTASALCFPADLVKGSRFESVEGGDAQFDLEITSVSKAKKNRNSDSEHTNESSKKKRRKTKKKNKKKGSV